MVRSFSLGLVISLLACGEPPSAPAAPGTMNTGGRPTPEHTNTKGKGDTEKTNTGGKPDPKRTNASKEPAGGAINIGGTPDFSKTTLPSLGGKDGGK